MRFRTWSMLLVAGVASVVSLNQPAVQAQAANGPTVMAEGKEFASGATYIMPGHSEENSLAIFTETLQTISFYNKTGKDMTIDKAEIAVGEGMVSEEFTLLKQSKRDPLGDVSETVSDGKNWSFRARFYPIETGTRTAKVTVTYNGDKTFELNLQGRARGEAKRFSHGDTVLHKLFGAAKTDEMLSGAVGGPEGSMYFTGHATQIADKFSLDIFWGKMNADGSLAWAKMWNGKYMDRTTDSGQNGETAGTANSLAVDEAGNLYICGATSDSSSNSLFSTLVIKVDGATGDPIWEKTWRPEWAGSMLGRHHSDAYGIALQGENVYVTGTSGGGNVLLLNLNAADGEVKSQFSFDPTPGSQDRGHAIVAHADNSVTIGGIASDRAFLTRINLAGETPKVTWSTRIDMGRGSNINCLSADAEGNVYASCDRRGATTFLSAIRVNNDGKLAWGKTFAGTNGDRNNTHLVRVIGDTVYVGGRFAASSTYDTSSGDGVLLALATADGAAKWTAFYYTGTGPDEVGEHRIKGIAINDKTVTIVGQSYTGSRNGVRYWGYWYDGFSTLEDYKPDTEDLGLAEDGVVPITTGAVKDASELRKLVDLTEKLDWVDAVGKTGQPGDGDIAIWQIKLK